MLSRFAFAGLAATLLGSAVEAAPTARANEPPPLQGATADVPAASRRSRTNVALRVLPPPKPDEFRGAAEEARPPIFSLFGGFPARQDAAEPAPASPPEASTSWFGTLLGGQAAQTRGTQLPPLTGRAEIDRLITHHARLNGVPESLVHRIVVRESKYNPRAVGSGGAMGLMQIKTGTARALGYTGGPAGLLDAETNITYAVKYLAGAWRTAGGSHDRAVMHYARGYYYEAKRQGLTRTAERRRGARQTADAAPAEAAAPALPSFLTFASGSAQDRSAR